MDLSRGRAQVRREVSPASTVLFVDSRLMKMGIVLNYMTEHKAALQMKTLCAHMNDDDFFASHYFASLSYYSIHNIVKIMSNCCKHVANSNHCSC